MTDKRPFDPGRMDQVFAKKNSFYARIYQGGHYGTPGWGSYDYLVKWMAGPDAQGTSTYVVVAEACEAFANEQLLEPVPAAGTLLEDG